jgi:hypothetical protein
MFGEHEQRHGICLPNMNGAMPLRREPRVMIVTKRQICFGRPGSEALLDFIPLEGVLSVAISKQSRRGFLVRSLSKYISSSPKPSTAVTVAQTGDGENINADHHVDHQRTNGRSTPKFSARQGSFAASSVSTVLASSLPLSPPTSELPVRSNFPPSCDASTPNSTSQRSCCEEDDPAREEPKPAKSRWAMVRGHTKQTKTPTFAEVVDKARDPWRSLNEDEGNDKSKAGTVIVKTSREGHNAGRTYQIRAETLERAEDMIKTLNKCVDASIMDQSATWVKRWQRKTKIFYDSDPTQMVVAFLILSAFLLSMIR